MARGRGRDEETGRRRRRGDMAGCRHGARRKEKCDKATSRWQGRGKRQGRDMAGNKHTDTNFAECML
eukprot:753030-Hanusia_phi.AAC.4